LAEDERLLVVRGARFEVAAIAAFSTTGNSGLMPHVRHGGIRNASLAGSKLDGTGLLKVQIGHIQLPVYVGTAAAGTEEDLNGLDVLDTGREELCSLCTAEEEEGCRLKEPRPLFKDLGCNVIFADDRRNPA
jgi:hypothetical protein